MDLPALVAHHLGRHGVLTALESGARTWTYAELDGITRERAAHLRRLCPDGGRTVVVGEHTADALIWALSVMRSGLVYTPLNPGLPGDRMREALRVAAPRLVLCCAPGTYAALAAEEPAGLVLAADEVAREAAEAAEGAEDAEDAEDALGQGSGAPEPAPAGRIAYSVFTSGSTGLPKLVNVGHRGIGNLCRAQTRLFGVKPGHRVLQFSSLSFDASVAEILVAVHAGARLVVPAWDGGSWIGAVARRLREDGCDIVTLPPSVYARLDDEARKAVGTVVFAGEALTEVEFRAAARYSRVLNAYGPTEGTVCFSVAEPSRFTGSIGRPVDGFTARVYDAERGAYADSGRGELVLVGDGVALGYEGVAADGDGPFTTVDGSPAYHTGDEVELHDGESVYLGRLDEQVKRLGHRIGLAELGGRLAQLTDASVVLLAEGTSLIMAHTATGRTDEELRPWLREVLPAWEVPDVLLAVSDIPLTGNGKADKEALRALARERRGGADEPGSGAGAGTATGTGIRSGTGTAAGTAAGTDDTAAVAAVVERVLGTATDPATSIFDAGGDSLALVRIQVELNELYGEEPVQAVFDLLDYDFSVASFVTGLHGLPGVPGRSGTQQPSAPPGTTPSGAAPSAAPPSGTSASGTGTSCPAPSSLPGGGSPPRPTPEQRAFDAVSAELAALPAVLAALRPPPRSAAGPRAAATGDAPVTLTHAVTLTGAGGFIGGHVLDRLLGTGRRITVVTTSAPERLIARHCARFERDPADLSAVEFLGYDDVEALADGTSAPAATATRRWGPVVHCGYDVNHLLPLERQLTGSVATTATLVRAAAALGAPRFVFLSAASAGPEFVPLTPEALGAVGDPYSQSKFVAEAYVAALEDGSRDVPGDTGGNAPGPGPGGNAPGPGPDGNAPARCRADLLRAGLVYGHGPREGAFLDRDVFAQMLRLSLLHGMPPRLDGLVPVCHVSDVVDALLAAAGSDGAGARSLLVGRTYDRHDLWAELGLATAEPVSPQEWLGTVTEAGTADVRVLAALRQSLGAAAGWTRPSRTTDRPIIRELRQTHLGA